MLWAPALQTHQNIQMSPIAVCYHPAGNGTVCGSPDSASTGGPRMLGLVQGHGQKEQDSLDIPRVSSFAKANVNFGGHRDPPVNGK